MARDDEIEAIIDVGRRTRTPLPRGLWLAGSLVGAICAAGFAVMMLGDAPPARHAIDATGAPGAGFGTGLVVGATGGVVAGFALARQRRDHSSRRSP